MGVRKGYIIKMALQGCLDVKKRMSSELSS